MEKNNVAFANDLMTITSDKGKDYEAEILDSFGMNGTEYMVCALFENEADVIRTDTICEGAIFKIVYGATETDDYLEEIEGGTDLYNTVYDKFMARNAEKYDFV